MKKVILNLLICCILAPVLNAQFLSENPEYQNIAREAYVDVYYEYSDLVTGGDGLSPKDSKVARGFWNIAESVRRRLICEAGKYRVISNIEKPAVNEFIIGDINLLAAEGMVILVEDRQGKIYRSDLSPVKARQNTWRAGYYYYDAHLLEFQLASSTGDILPLEGEIVLHAYPDKIHIEAKLKLVEGLDLKQASLVCHFEDKVRKADPGWMVQSGESILGVLGGEVKKKTISVSLVGENAPGGLLKGHLVFIPGDDENKLGKALAQEANPLPPSAFLVKNGLNEGYDPAAGFYLIKNNNGLSADGFTSFFLNPNMYLSTGLDITNDGLARKVYIKHYSEAGSIESAILTDSTGFPLPVPIECAKNFGGEKEEPDETPFNESYFPIQLEPSERKVFNVLHLHQNWGDHGLRQISSIRFFQIYYHLSQGVTETTCFSLPTKFDSILTGETRAYTLADYRPLSGQTWHGSPQHHHVALQGWLQYQDAGGNWRYPVYKGGEIYSSGPNLAWFTMNYVSSDGKVDQQLEIFEMPQSDESRTHIRLRYTFNEDVEIGGEVTRNLRLLNSGSYIRKVNWKELAWTGPDGEVRTHPIQSNGEWAIAGEALRPYNAFFSAYPHPDANNGVVIRKVSGKVNGEFFNRVGFSAISHEDGKTELMLVPLIEGKIISKGSVIEIDCIQIPFGNEHSNWGTPYEESVRFGLNKKELDAYRDLAGLAGKEEPVFGPNMEVLHGKKVLDLPPFVKAEENYASVRINGGHERTSLVASGFSHAKYPLLWEEEAYLDPQVRGHDGIQAFPNQDGTYGFIFTPKVRTTKVSGEWGSRPHTYHITQAISGSDIREISSVNGLVKIEQFEAGAIELMSPRLWCPARNEIQDSPLNRTYSDSRIIETVPMTVTGERNPREIEVVTYGPDLILMNVISANKFGLLVRGLFPGSIYLLDTGGTSKELTSDRHGILSLALDAMEDSVEIKIHKK